MIFVFVFHEILNRFTLPPICRFAVAWFNEYLILILTLATLKINFLSINSMETTIGAHKQRIFFIKFVTHKQQLFHVLIKLHYNIHQIIVLYMLCMSICCTILCVVHVCLMCTVQYSFLY